MLTRTLYRNTKLIKLQKVQADHYLNETFYLNLTLKNILIGTKTCMGNKPENDLSLKYIAVNAHNTKLQDRNMTCDYTKY